ncbi:MAG: XdhC family protein [Ignavibacteria bacterium]|nr:XdhC family protein [Ignavibacteria bacterium]
MKEIHLWNFIHTHITNNHSILLITVIENTKGSPGKQGFKMAVSSNGDSVGSIGGGVMEYNAAKECNHLLENKIYINRIETLHHNKNTSVKSSGLICSGSQTNFTTVLSKKDTDTVLNILNAMTNLKPGKIIFNQKGIIFKSSAKKLPDFNYVFKNERDWKFEQATGKEKIVYLIGGGHVGLALSKVLSLLDFYVIVYDNRDDLRTFKENNYADKKIAGAYKDLGKIIEPDSYVVIVTTGFESDKEALKQVINKNVKYIGLMGTKAKIKKIFAEALKDGVRKEQLKTIHAPVGININSDTPEEIAVSIAAEIIREKNNSLL